MQTGISPDKVTLSALLLVLMENAAIARVTIAQLIETLEHIEQLDDGEDVEESSPLVTVN